MRLISIACGLAVLQSALSDKGASLFVALAAAAGALAAESLILYKRGRIRELGDCSALAAALVLSILLPNRLPPLCAFLGAVFAVAVVKHTAGGLGANWMNPALGGWLFIRVSWPALFDQALEGAALGLVPREAAASLAEGPVRDFLNTRLFSFFGAAIPSGYLGLFCSPAPGLIADRGLLGLLAGTLILCTARVGRRWVPLLFLLCYTVLVRLWGGPAAGQGDMLTALLSGGTLAVAFIVIADPASGAKSAWGCVAAAAACGALAFVIRYPGGNPWGGVYAAALLNALIPLIRQVENALLYDRPAAPAGNS
jgi:electron transport complex protein RnfD